MCYIRTYRLHHENTNDGRIIAVAPVERMFAQLSVVAGAGLRGECARDGNVRMGLPEQFGRIAEKATSSLSPEKAWGIQGGSYHHIIPRALKVWNGG